MVEQDTTAYPDDTMCWLGLPTGFRPALGALPGESSATRASRAGALLGDPIFQPLFVLLLTRHLW